MERIINLIVKNGRGAKYLLVLVLMLVLVAIPNVRTVEAADFGYSGLGDIICVYKLNNGNIRAIDGAGKVADFDYVKWTTVKTMPYYLTVKGIDTSSGYISAVSINLSTWESQNILINMETLQVTNMPTNLPLNNAIRYKGYYYSATFESGTYSRVGLSRYNLNGDLISTVWGYSGSGMVDSKNPSAEITGIDYTNNRIMVTGRRLHSFNVSDFTLYGYQAETSAGLDISIFGTTGSGSSTVYGIQTNYPRYTYSGNRSVGGNIAQGYKWGYSPDIGCLASIKEANVWNIYRNGNQAYLTGLPYAYFVACYDKFGNTILGGESGRVVAMATSGVLSTDSNFYSDYLKQDAIVQATLARESADQAKIMATQVYNEVNNTEYGLKSINQKIDDLKLPAKITKVSTVNNATATKASSIEIIIEAEDATKYRARVGTPPGDEEWAEINSLTITGLVPGANTIHVQASNDSNKITSSTIVVFRI